MGTVQELLRIERSVVLRAPRSRVWRALTRKEEFSAWFDTTLTGDFEPGSKTIMKVNYPGYEHLVFPPYVQRKEPEVLFSWRWVPGNVFKDTQDESQQTEVTFTLEDVPEGTRLTVVESGFDRVDLQRRAEAFEQNTEGWQGQLANLETYLGRTS